MDRQPQAGPMIIHCQELRNISWQIPFYGLLSERSKIHLWVADLRNYSDEQLVRFCTLLSKEEQKKLRQLHFERDRRRFIISKTILRKLLARYLDKAPEKLSLRYDGYNKPFLFPNPDRIQFQTSHSGHKIVMVFRFDAKSTCIGIDVERMDTSYDYSHVISNFFSAEEQREIRRQASIELFFKYWTRKEAILKALGAEFPSDIRHLNVAGSTNVCHEIRHWSRQPFYVHSFRLDERYMVSFAIPGQSFSHNFIDFDFIM